MILIFEQSASFRSTSLHCTCHEPLTPSAHVPEQPTHQAVWRKRLWHSSITHRRSIFSSRSCTRRERPRARRLSAIQLKPASSRMASQARTLGLRTIFEVIAREQESPELFYLASPRAENACGTSGRCNCEGITEQNACSKASGERVAEQWFRRNENSGKCLNNRSLIINLS